LFVPCVKGFDKGGVELRKLFFAAGILAILAGAILASMYNIPVTVKAEELVKQDYGVWEVSANFTTGDKIIARPRYASSWTTGVWDIDDIIPYNHRHIFFYFIDPSGGTTEWNTAWSSHDLKQGQLALVYINATVFGEGLYVTSLAENSTYPTYLGGIALLNGTYTFICDKEMEPTPPNVTAPAWMGLSREYPDVRYPNTTLLPIGISIIGVGVVVSVVSARSKKKIVQRGRTGR
jgi:hypothetical protein